MYQKHPETLKAQKLPAVGTPKRLYNEDIEYLDSTLSTLWSANMAMENPSFIDDVPNQTSISSHLHGIAQPAARHVRLPKGS